MRVRSGVLSDASTPPPAAAKTDVRVLLARRQIRHGEAKARAMNGKLDALNKDEKSVVSTLSRAKSPRW
jgi:hypothetical protein